MSPSFVFLFISVIDFSTIMLFFIGSSAAAALPPPPPLPSSYNSFFLIPDALGLG